MARLADRRLAASSIIRTSRVFLLNEVGRQFEGPVFASVFVEEKDLVGLTMPATVNNMVTAAAGTASYAGCRNIAPIDVIETRNRLIGPIFSLSVRGTF